jgi:hypothetical protein
MVNTKQTQRPRNAQEAMAHALRHERALQIVAEGLYSFYADKDTDAVAVCRKGSFAATYWLNLMEPGCDCPDSLKGNYCKHERAWSILQDNAAAADEQANMEAQCKEWEDYHLPELPTVEATARRLLVEKMERDLIRTQDAIAQHGARKTNYLTAQQQRDKAHRLENAIVIINQYRSLPICPTCDSELPFCLCTQPDGPTFMNEVL